MNCLPPPSRCAARAQAGLKRQRPNEGEGGVEQHAPPGMDPAGGAGGMGGGMGGGGMGDGFPCVKLRGLPFDVMEGDIKMFLVGMDEDGACVA